MESDSKPKDEEVKLQLQRILASRYFKKRVKLGEVLTFIVNARLEGRTLDQNDILEGVYGYRGYDPGDSHVRTAVHDIRRLLPKYYQTEGQNDQILISMPKRQGGKTDDAQVDAYHVVIDYNSRRKANGVYGLVLDQLRTLSPGAVGAAMQHLDWVLQENPEHLQARLAAIECLCLNAVYQAESSRRVQLIQNAIEAARLFASQHPTEWRAQVFLAIALFFNHDYVEAMNTATEAVRQWPAESNLSLWVATMYLLINMPDVAASRALRIAGARGKDIRAFAAYGFFLYFKRDFTGAEDIFLKMQQLNPAEWIIYLGLVLVYLSLNQPDRALACHRQMRSIMPGQEVMPGLGLLAAYRAHPDSDAGIPRYLLEQRDRLLKLPMTDKDFLQIAILLIDDEPEAAVNSLSLAWQGYQPLSLLLDFWPVFDPLRDRDDFRQLVGQMGLPRRAPTGLQYI